MFLMHLKADPPFREEKTDLTYPVSTPRLGKSLFIYLYVISELPLSPSTSQSFIQPLGRMVHLKVELSKVKWNSAVLMKHRDDGGGEICVPMGQDITSGGLKKKVLLYPRRINMTDKTTKLYLTLSL